MYRNILIPTDGSELSKKAIEHGVALAKALGAKVTAVTVTMPFHIFASNLPRRSVRWRAMRNASPNGRRTFSPS